MAKLQSTHTYFYFIIEVEHEQKREAILLTIIIFTLDYRFACW